jgi:ABC-type branched-subunit amino acid transport system substrate-binding protein/DNA-binding beta-propeller fold protein YncE
MSTAIVPGTTFAGYRVESLVGRGGMGVVYRATDVSLDRPVALKLVAPELAEDERFRERFEREPRLAASLDHPNVIPIYEAGEHAGQLYLAMRFVKGSDLKTLLERDGRLAPERAVRILAQVGGALDAAHRRALVHRDVKPANVLLDEEGHAYLTDFGITKQIGGASTDTAGVVGTLDYLAPEQIRGDPVEGRTDGYALGCVLYECLAGEPPFRRATEAETLWAHMQEQPAPLRAHPRLDPVVRKALAKDREKRYATCTELIDAAAGALGVGHARAARRPLVPAALLGRGRLLVASGLLLLAAAIAATVVALTTGEEARIEPLGTGVAAIDPATGDVASLTESKTPPGNVAVGEGAVWVLTDGEDTVSRIDPQTNEITGTVETPGTPSQLAAGEGALWVGRSGGRFVNTTVGISRVDPRTNRVTSTVTLPDTTGGGTFASPNTGFPQIAVGAGAVWARNPDDTISRIDPDTGALVKRIDVAASTVAAGKEGVWFVPFDRPSVKRIDPRTNRVVQTIRIGSNSLPAIAVGAGSVWATAESEGLIHRIVPGERPTTRTIDVGVGVSYVAFGHGAVWTANYIDGTVSRIDPRTNDVTATVSAGSPQALAVGEGSAWVSVVGAGREGALPAFACGGVVTGRARPDVLIASDLPLRGPQSAGPRAMAEAIRFVLERRGFKAGKHSVGYASCDDSTSQSGSFELRRCAANANAYAHARQLVAVIGPYNSGCAIVEIPILNRAPGGPLAAISPSNTHPGLTRARSSNVPPFIRGQPQVFYPTGIRSYVRVAPRDDLQGAASVVLAKELGLGSLYLLHDGGYWGALLPDAFGRAARELGVRIAGSEAFDPDAETYASLADEVARSGAQGVVLGAQVSGGGDRVLKALRDRLGDRIPIIASDGFTPISDVVGLAGRAAQGLYVTITDVPASRRLQRELGPTASAGFIVQAAQATEVVLGAIARSDGSRSSVLEQLRATRVRNGPLGTFRFDRNGDITPAKLTVVRVTPEAPPDPRLPAIYRGATVDRVLQVPSDFAG